MSILGYYEKKRLDNLTIHNISPTNAELAGCRSESQSGVDGDICHNDRHNYYLMATNVLAQRKT